MSRLLGGMASAWKWKRSSEDTDANYATISGTYLICTSAPSA